MKKLENESFLTVTLRTVELVDHAALELLKARYKMAPSSEHEWRHMYEGSALPASLDFAWPIGWVLETPEGVIVGHIGNVPIEYSFAGRIMVAASASCWVVDVDYRKSSSDLSKKFFAQTGVDLLSNTTATWPSGRAFERLGAIKPPVAAYDRSAFWIIDHQKFASSLLIKKKLPLPQVLALPVGAVLSAVSWMRNIGRCHPRQHTYISEVNTIDERFDRFWEKLRAQPNRLLCVRDRAAVAWRFDRPVRAGNAWIFSYEHALRDLAGYAVFLRQDSPEIGLRRIRLVDFQSEGDGAKFLHDAIEVALSRCHTEGIHVLESIGFGNVRRKQIDALAPYQRQLPSWMFWYKVSDQNPELAKALLNPDVWDPCTYDGDGCF